MTRYYLEVPYRVTPVDAVDEHADAMTDADVGADLRHGWSDAPVVARPSAARHHTSGTLWMVPEGRVLEQI